jgi:hypothetical protein
MPHREALSHSQASRDADLPKANKRCWGAKIRGFLRNSIATLVLVDTLV